MQYGKHVSIAVSTPAGTDVHVHSSQQEDSYQQIIPGIPQGSLYPTLSSIISEAVTSNDEVQSLRDNVSKGLDKYLQDAEQCCALELNYFDDTAKLTSVEPMSEAAEQTNKSSEHNLSSAKQTSMKETVSAANIPKSLKRGTSHTSQQPSQLCTNTDEKCQRSPSSEHAEQDADGHQDNDEHPAEDIDSKFTPTHTDQILTVLLSTDEVIIPTKKVGCILVTSHLQQFLEDYPPSSDKEAFLDVYHMLSLLDKYLYDNPKQHTHCMSSDNEYVT